MAGGSSGEKTEQPTPKKLRDSRKKGQVARSKEVAGTIGLVVLFAYIWINKDNLQDGFTQLFLVTGDAATLPFSMGLAQVADATAAHLSIQLLAPIIAITVAVAIVGNIIQVGFMASLESVKPSLNKLNPANALKKMVSAKNLMDFGKNILKVTILSIIIFLIVRDGLGDLVRSGSCGLNCTLPVFGSLIGQLIIFAMAIFIIAAGVDYALERWQWMKGLMMTKDEVKREYKEMEGDPHIKGRRKQLHREIINMETTQSTKRATAVVTNPTHFAVAIRYDREEAPLPVVLAKGENIFARQIIEVAEEFEVPIMQNVDLARALYDRAEIDELIPPDLIEPVAEVIRWVRKLAREKTINA